MGTLDGGEVELSPLGESPRKKKNAPSPQNLKVTVSSLCYRSDDHRLTAVGWVQC